MTIRACWFIPPLVGNGTRPVASISLGRDPPDSSHNCLNCCVSPPTRNQFPLPDRDCRYARRVRANAKRENPRRVICTPGPRYLRTRPRIMKLAQHRINYRITRCGRPLDHGNQPSFAIDSKPFPTFLGPVSLECFSLS